MRFEPTWWWKPSYVPYSDYVDSNFILYCSQFVGVLLLCTALIIERSRQKRRQIVYCGGLVLIAFWISKGYHGPLEGLNDAFYHLPGAFLFREPTTKAPLLALLALIPIMAYGLDALYALFSHNAIARRASAVLATGLICAAGYPAVSGALYHDVTDEVPGLYARMPGYWRDMAAFMNNEHDNGAVLMLPLEQFYQMNYGWFYGADTIADWLLLRPVVHIGDSGYAYTQGILEGTIDNQISMKILQRDPNIVGMLQHLGVRYILIRGDVADNPSFNVTRSDLPVVFSTFRRRKFGPLTRHRDSERHERGCPDGYAASAGWRSY